MSRSLVKPIKPSQKTRKNTLPHRPARVIQNIISLCFFVAGYFYENQHQIIKDPQVIIICQLANGKGNVSKYFYLEGLKILANFILFQDFVKQQNLTQEQVNQLLSMV